jgi:hypothetical protein
MAADPIGSPGWPELAFCTMSTARNRSVLMHNSSNAGGAALLRDVAEGAMARFAFHVAMGEYRTWT